MRIQDLAAVLLLLSATSYVSGAESSEGLRATPVLPDGLGVNIHFTNPRPGEMKMLAEGGFRWVRMDFAWSGIEREKGRYDFKAYDQLLAALEPHGIRALLILDYSNPWYDQGLSPASDEGRRAFARWAAAAADRFRGRGILWEMYNEPNIHFWKPKPDVRQYVKLALEVGKAIRAVAPAERYVGPGTSQIDIEFLEECFKAGLLNYWTAVTVHPYRQNAPETAAPEYARLRQLIRRYAPQGSTIPIISGEWGYSAAWRNHDAAIQGKLLARQWLVNLVNDIPLSIWYDWHDDGTNPKDPEHHFGTVQHRYFADREPVYDPKPAYLAAQALARTLAGFRLSKRLDLGSEEDFALLFANQAGEVRAAVWTTSPRPHPISVPASPGRFKITGHTAEALPPAIAGPDGLRLVVSDAPQYLVPETPNDLWRVAMAWTRAPLEIAARAPANVTVDLAVQNPLARPLRLKTVAGPDALVEPLGAVELPPGARRVVRCTRRVVRGGDPCPVRIELEVETLGRLVQTLPIAVDNPLRVTALPAAGRSLPVRLENPSGEEFRGAVSLTDADGIAPAGKADVRLAAGQTEQVVAVPLDRPAATSYRVAVRLEEEQGEGHLVVPPTRFTAVDDFARYSADELARAYQLVPDGDRRVASEQSLWRAEPPEGPPAAGAGCLKISYRFEQGWKFVYLAPQGAQGRPIAGRPRSVGMWIHGDGTGNLLRLRVVDATDQTIQPHGKPMGWKGWRYVVFPLDGSAAGHWGGANDGVVHYPLRCSALVLIDSAGQKKTEGAIYVSAPTLIE